MSLMVLVPLSLVMGAIGLAAFLWALHDGQYEDPEGAAWRVLTPADRPGSDEDKLKD